MSDFSQRYRKQLTAALLLTGILLTTGCATSPRQDTSSLERQKLLTHFESWRGTPYAWGGNSRNGMDCSAFVQTTYRQVYGKSLPRSTRDQEDTGRRVRSRSLQPGDLVFFKTGWFDRHVGIYVGRGEFIHASESAGVTKSSLHSAYWSDHFWKAKRP